MVCGTASDVGKSAVVAGLCRLLARRGVRVAPFKAQNMALNSYVTPSGHEIGRAQGVQALAAGVEPEVAMNPILLKPTGERTSQVVVLGKPWAHLDAVAYHEAKPGLLNLVLECVADLRSRFDVLVCEGAGSPATAEAQPATSAPARRSGSAAAARLFTDHWGWRSRRRRAQDPPSSGVSTYPMRKPGQAKSLVREPSTTAPWSASPRVQRPVARG